MNLISMRVTAYEKYMQIRNTLDNRRLLAVVFSPFPLLWMTLTTG